MDKKRAIIYTIIVICIGVAIAYCLDCMGGSNMPETNDRKIDSLIEVTHQLNKDFEKMRVELDELGKKKKKIKKELKNEIDIIRHSPYDSAVKHISDYLSENSKN